MVCDKVSQIIPDLGLKGRPCYADHESKVHYVHKNV